jgi:hypothetical protein
MLLGVRKLAALPTVRKVDFNLLRVVQGRRGFGFPLETAESLRIVGEFVG